MNCEITEGNIRRGLTFRGSEAHVPTTDFSLGDGCLFCGKPEKSYSPDKGVEFICGNCVVLLSAADRDDLRRAHVKAIATGYLNKANAIQSFLEEEEEYYGETKKSKRNLERARPVPTARPSRNQVRA